MKKLLTISFLLLFSTSYSQKLSVDTEKSKIKWIGKEITTSMHYGTLKFSGGEISLSSDRSIHTFDFSHQRIMFNLLNFIHRIFIPLNPCISLYKLVLFPHTSCNN